MKLMTGRKSIRVNRVGQLSRGSFLCRYLKEDTRYQVPEDDIERLIAKGEMYPVFENDDFNVYRIGSPEKVHIHNIAMHWDGNSAALHSRQ